MSGLEWAISINFGLLLIILGCLYDIEKMLREIRQRQRN
jgi:hypothetical protein